MSMRVIWCICVYLPAVCISVSGVVNTVCVCVCVVYVMSMFLCGEVHGGLCHGYGVCVCLCV